MIDIEEIQRRIQFMRENNIRDPFALSLDEMVWICDQLLERHNNSTAPKINPIPLALK